jgi:hypothetical protein
MHMIAHGAGDADATLRTFSLKPCRYIYRLTVQVGPVGNRVAKVDPYAKAHGSIGGLIAILDRNLFLYLHGAAYRPVYAVEYDQQGVTSGLNDPATVFFYCWVY